MIVRAKISLGEEAFRKLVKGEAVYIASCDTEITLADIGFDAMKRAIGAAVILNETSQESQVFEVHAIAPFEIQYPACPKCGHIRPLFDGLCFECKS